MLMTALAALPPQPVDPVLAQHEVEYSVHAALMSHPGVHFSSLVVRRVPEGICLQGVLEADEAGHHSVDKLARRVAGVNIVLNHLLRCHPLPLKG